MTVTRDADAGSPLHWLLMVLALIDELLVPEPAQPGPSRRHRAPETEGELGDERKGPRRAARVAGVA